MKGAGIQIMQTFLQRCRVEIDQDHFMQPSERNPLVTPFGFKGIPVTTGFGGVRVADHSSGDPVYQLVLEVGVDNVRREGRTEQKFSPYKFDLQVVAWIRVDLEALAGARPDDVAAIQGAMWMYASIREQVANLTSRMPSGAIYLPAASFESLAGNTLPMAETAEATVPAAKSPGRKRVRKTEA